MMQLEKTDMLTTLFCPFKSPTETTSQHGAKKKKDKSPH